MLGLLVIGLGNPDSHFEGTRHNVGFEVVETVASRVQLRMRKPLFGRYRRARLPDSAESRGLTLIQPLTYMNRSGEVVPALLRRYSLAAESMLVVCDNLDLAPGRVRMKQGGGTAGHKGLASIVDAVGHGNFPRLYLGVGRPQDGNVVEHVLGLPDAAERSLYDDAIVRAAEAVLALRDHSAQQVMNEINRR